VKLLAAFAAGVIVGLALTSVVYGAAAPFCERKPNHPRCLPAPTSSPGASPASLTFGLGSQTESAIRSRLTAEAPIRILSNWYNGPADLGWMTDSYHRGIYADAKAQGFELHLITWSQTPEATLTTPYGPACGREYPLSARWLDDMRQIAEAMRPDLVTLFTEFQTYPCTDNRWTGSENYYRALIDQYERAVPIFRAVGSKVSIGWGGWQLQTDRSLDSHFTAVTEDFHSFQAMHGVSNVQAIRDMTAFLGAPAMLAHHMPDGDTNDDATRNATFAEDWRQLATDTSIASLVADGLFAWSIVNDVGWSDIPETYELVRDAVTRYGR
jgi:hypothetical protein